RGFRVRTGECRLLRHGCSASLDLLSELLEQVSVRLGVDLAAEQLRSSSHGERSHFLGELLTRAAGLELHFLASLADQALAFSDRGAARFIHELVRATVRLLDDLA